MYLRIRHGEGVEWRSGEAYDDCAGGERAKWALRQMKCGRRRQGLPIFALLIHVGPECQQLVCSALLTDRRRQVERCLADIVIDRWRRAMPDQGAHNRGMPHA